LATDLESLAGVFFVELCAGVLVPLRFGVSSFLLFVERRESSMAAMECRKRRLRVLRHGGARIQAMRLLVNTCSHQVASVTRGHASLRAAAPLQLPQDPPAPLLGLASCAAASSSLWHNCMYAPGRRSDYSVSRQLPPNRPWTLNEPRQRLRVPSDVPQHTPYALTSGYQNHLWSHYILPSCYWRWELYWRDSVSISLWRLTTTQRSNWHHRCKTRPQQH